MKYTDFERYLAKQNKISLPSAFLFDQMYKKRKKNLKNKISTRIMNLNKKELDNAWKELELKHLIRKRRKK